MIDKVSGMSGGFADSAPGGWVKGGALEQLSFVFLTAYKV